MDSKRRKIEVHIWDAPFFSNLNDNEIPFWFFINCKCDNIGIYQHNPRLAEFHCRGKIDLNHFLSVVNYDKERIERIDENLLWIRDFVRETWGTITAENNLGKSCWKLLIKHGMTDRFIREFPDCIKIKTFREAIGNGELPAPQLQGSDRPVTENADSESFESQGSDRAVTFNYNSNYNESRNRSESINTPENSENDWKEIDQASGRILNLFPEAPEFIQFEEREIVKKHLRKAVLNGVKLPEAEDKLTHYLKSQETALFEEGGDFDIKEILEGLEVQYGKK